ncbi:RimJ/RimL family protein N-acetyltransferase [Humibacillus xanthopallidus]|uniref:RimJ/RimL family protein N-acetyltransferase n=1 Tax=Humibacillus xanthopallidus TaxID=412689 RepID=A0A543PSQ0_9MICO|nr:GNAT family N-acetyltransferase [Humibacillus xanthopallidus]TQN47109.1 RimJ/RimL family protein N-acetyltransferase [Humibacillus xanthopallidus]
MRLVDVWPLHGLRLTTADLELRPTTEAELPQLCTILPSDLETDPAATRYAGLDDRANHRAILAQSYWRAMGTWSTHDWVVPFAVRHDGELVGMQALEGPDWTSDRTVDSWSWLTTDSRGRGWGKQMRAAVLALAFGSLGARTAISSAVIDNVSSLGVSRSLGYRETHVSVLEHSGQTLRHVRLDRDAWQASGLADEIVVEGVDPATLALFGGAGDA